MAVQKAESSSAASLTKFETQRKQITDQISKIAAAEAKVKDLKQTVLRFQNERTVKEKQYQSRESKMRRSAAICRAYEEEIFAKDGEILKREKNLAALEKQIEDLKKGSGDIAAKIKQAVSETLLGVNGRLADKENEIKLLKEMVRSTNV